MISDRRSTLARELLDLAARDPDLPASLLQQAADELSRPPEIEVVEQGTLARAPDGWSWDDVGPFTGYWSGIRLQKGEPILEQDGHFLLIRQGETSFTDRQESIYRGISGVETHDESDRRRHPASVLVVHGFKGARTAYTLFRAGDRLSPVFVDGAADVLGFVLGWLSAAHDDPIEKRKLPPRPPRKERLDDAP